MSKKVSSKRLASIAGTVLRRSVELRAARKNYVYLWTQVGGCFGPPFKVSDIHALAASVLSQTEPKKKKVKK